MKTIPDDRQFPPATPPEQWLTTRQTAEKLGLKYHKLYKLAKAKRVRYTNMGFGTKEDMRFKLSQVNADLEALSTASQPLSHVGTARTRRIQTADDRKGGSRRPSCVRSSPESGLLHGDSR